MTLRDAAELSASSLAKNPVRTLLTILGLGVGIGAILTVLTLGSAGQLQVESEIARLGVDKVWITAGADTLRPLQPEDSALVASAVSAPVCAGASTLGPVSQGSRTLLGQISGYDAGIEAVHHPVVQAGRLFTAREYAAGSAVAVIDQSMADALGGEAVGTRIRVGSRSVRVVGVISDMITQVLSSTSGTVLLPLRTYMDTYAASSVAELTVGVPRGQRAEAIGAAAEEALTALGGVYKASSLQEEIDAARSVIRIFVMVLACVAAVCMLTGSIGVMNILLVSVRERRREIGLIKAIGGTSRQVGLLFLLEAVCYALMGGLAGLLLGVAMIRLFGAWIGLSASLSASVALPALLAAAALGILFGVAPALRAARMVPVEALKTE